MLEVRMMKAKEGDFILVSYGKTDDIHHLIIDGGVKDCARNFSNLIREISEKNQIIDAIVLTHVDYDHIAGACEGIAKTDSDILKKCVKKIIFNFPKQLYDEIIVDSNNGGYSIDDGKKFINVLKEKGLYNRLETNITSGKIIQLDGLANLKFISPGKNELNKFYNNWESYEKSSSTSTAYATHNDLILKDLKELMKERTTTDSSINNNASLAFLFEYEAIKGVFLGDSKPTVCIEGLKKLAINQPYDVNFIKLSHHGSRANTSEKLLKMLNTKTYLLSTNGHGQKVPSKIIISKLIKNCIENKKNSITLYCNYKWWKNEYYNEYFTENDKIDYLNNKVLIIECLNDIQLKKGL